MCAFPDVDTLSTRMLGLDFSVFLCRGLTKMARDSVTLLTALLVR